MPLSGQVYDPHFLDAAALLDDLRPIFASLGTRSDWPSCEELTELAEAARVRHAPELPAIRFAPAKPRPRRRRRSQPINPAELYDGSIALLGEVPCLPGSYHDLFNALVWVAFPRSKRALHQRQYRALSEHIRGSTTRLPGARTREQDALTVFDEGGSVALFPLPEGGAEGAPAPRVMLFGHALMEHVLYGRPKVRSSAVHLNLPLPLAEGADLLRLVDEALAERLADPYAFLVPGADGVVELDTHGQVLSVGVTRPRDQHVETDRSTPARAAG
jgi:hypothetical protein